MTLQSRLTYKGMRERGSRKPARSARMKAVKVLTDPPVASQKSKIYEPSGLISELPLAPVGIRLIRHAAVLTVNKTGTLRDFAGQTPTTDSSKNVRCARFPIATLAKFLSPCVGRYDKLRFRMAKALPMCL